jgi:hypothetical protein
MNDEWVELTGYNLESEECTHNIIRKSAILAIVEPEEGALSALLLDIEGTKLEHGPMVVLAGEYDIVRDEITGGKWSRARHRKMQIDLDARRQQAAQIQQDLSPYRGLSGIMGPVGLGPLIG